MEDYVMMIAQDHGRVFSEEVNETLKDIDSGKVKTITQTANELIKQMRKELVVKK